MKGLSWIQLVTGMLLISCTNTPKLEDTPLAINDIREIGELITAEYYGEVIQSLKTVSKADIEYELETDFDYLQQLYGNYAAQSKNDNKLVRQFRQHEITKDFRFERMQKLCNKNDRKFILDILAGTDWSLFKLTYAENITAYLTKRENKDKGEVVYLGRGWVKAGFDLSQIDFNSNVFISNDTLTIRNLDPILLDADINPWLVPNKIKGFEIIKMEKKVSLHQIHNVKKNCKLRLKEEAIASGIYEHALAAGTQSLEGLFGLMQLPGTGIINTVIIEPTKYFEYKFELLKDARIDSNEFVQIQKLVSADTTLLDSAWYSSMEAQVYYLQNFIGELEDETRGNYNFPKWGSFLNEYKH